MGWAIECGTFGCRTVWHEDEPPPPYADEGEALRQLRLQAYLTLREAAVVLSISAVQFSHCEHGRERFTPEQERQLRQHYAQRIAERGAQ